VSLLTLFRRLINGPTTDGWISQRWVAFARLLESFLSQLAANRWNCQTKCLSITEIQFMECPNLAGMTFIDSPDPQGSLDIWAGGRGINSAAKILAPQQWLHREHVQMWIEEHSVVGNVNRMPFCRSELVLHRVHV